jgi:CHAD domain-containing protein
VTAPDRSPVELELKYRVLDLAAAERYLIDAQFGPFSGGAVVRSTHMEDRYIDTESGAFAKAGFAARLRQAGRGTIVSVKALARGDGPGGAARRVELEGPAEQNAAPRDWPVSDARALVLELAGDAPLFELVTVRQVRRRRIVRAAETRVEFSLDEVDVVSGSRVVDRFVEFEAELVKGDEGPLAALATVLDADPALVSEAGSKLETALAALQRDRGDDGNGLSDRDVAAGSGAGPDGAGVTTGGVDVERDGDAAEGSSDARAVMERETTEDGSGVPDAWRGDGDGDHVAELDVLPSTSDVVSETVEEAVPPDNRLVVGKTPGVAADDHLAEAGRKVMRFHLARMLAREAGTRDGRDLEDLHAMRVATRRQRAAWRVFGSTFRDRRTRRYRNGLREIASRLGVVRDLDVLIEAADLYRADMPITEQRALQPLLDDWRTRRDNARVLLVRELDSDRYKRWVDDYRDFVQTEGAAVLPVLPTQPHRVRDTAASRIWAAYEQVRAYEPVLRWADVETLHELRISGKWLRYTLEFVRDALGDDAAPLIARVTALQDHLGLMNDADVSASLARTFLVEHAGELSGIESAAIGRYLVSREKEVARLRRTVGPTWRGVAGVSFRRGLGRVVAGL